MDGSVLHASPSSLYGQVGQDLLSRIVSGQFPPGCALPTETVLCEQYGVSRITVRRAVADLAARGLVVRRRGIGSFVAIRSGEQREFHLTGFLEETRNHDIRTISAGTVPADADTAEALRVQPGTPVRHIRSVVHRDAEAFTVADAFTVDSGPLRGEETDYASKALSVQVLGRRLGRRIERAEQQIDAVTADPVLVEHLGLKRGSAVLRARRTYFTVDDQPIQFLVIRYHPARYRFFVDLLPRAGTSAFQAQAGVSARSNNENMRVEEEK